jgi:pyruvate carboxylase subunit B
MADRTFRALVNDRTVDVTLGDSSLTLDGTPVRHSFEPVGEAYFSLLIDGRSVPVVVTPMDDGRLRVSIDGRTQVVRVQDEQDLLLERFGLEDAADTAEREVRAPMPGLVLRVMVAEGEQVQKGDGLLVLEAMKMENELCAPATGVVQAIHAATDEAVDKDALLIEINTGDA